MIPQGAFADVAKEMTGAQVAQAEQSASSAQGDSSLSAQDQDDEAPEVTTQSTAWNSSNCNITATNLTVTPTSAETGDLVTVTFGINALITGTQQASFQEGDTITVATNLGDLFNFSSDWTGTLVDGSGATLATYVVSGDSMTITLAAAAAGKTSFSTTTITSVTAGASRLITKDPGQATLSTNVTVAGVSVPLTVSRPANKTLNIEAKGSGTVAFTAGADASATSTTLNTGSVTIVATPTNGMKLVSLTLTKADGTTKTYPVSSPDTSATTFNIPAEDLIAGTNTLKAEFTAIPGTDIDLMWKNVWGVDNTGAASFASSANNDIGINMIAARNLYRTNGASVSATFPDKVAKDNLIVEDTLPGGTDGTLQADTLHIYAMMPWYATDDAGYYPVAPETSHMGAAGQTDLIAGGYLTKIDQKSGDTYATFRARIAATSMSYGVFVDPDTNVTTIACNLGSPGDTAVPGLKCSDLWPDQLKDTYTNTINGVTNTGTVLNQLNGDGNAVGGKVQQFRMTFRTDHSSTVWDTQYTNNAYVSCTSEDGSTVDKADRTASYWVTTGKTLAAGNTGELTIQKFDAASTSDNVTAIKGATFKVQKWDETSGKWVDYTTASGDAVTGTTDDNGQVTLGVMIVGKYRAVETSAGEGYDASTAKFSTATSSQGDVSSDGVFTVSESDTKGFVATCSNEKAVEHTVTYDYGAAPAGASALPASATHTSGDSVTVAAAATAPGYTFSGWADSAATDPVAISNGSFTMPSRDVTLTGTWTPKTYPVTFVNGDHGTTTGSGTSQSVDYDGHATTDNVTVTPDNGYKQTSWTYTITGDDGTVTNGSTDDPTSVAITGATVFTPVYETAGKANITTSKTVSNEAPNVGDQLVYTIVVRNTGNATSDRVWVKDFAPDNTTFVSCDSTGTYHSTLGGKEYVTWFTSPIEPGGSVTLTLTVKVNECQSGTNITNTAAYIHGNIEPSPGTDPGNGTPTPTATSKVAGSASGTISSTSSAGATTPKTGDTLPVAGGALACIGALVLFAAFIARRKRDGR